MKARISQLHRTEAEWLRCARWVPDAGELVIYDPDETHLHARLKVGDGVRMLQELDFFIDSAIEAILDQISFSDTIDGGRISANKN